MTPTRIEAAVRVIRLPMMSREEYEQFKDDLKAALAAEREPLLAALRKVLAATDDSSLDAALYEARALIEQDGRTEQ